MMGITKNGMAGIPSTKKVIKIAEKMRKNMKSEGYSQWEYTGIVGI